MCLSQLGELNLCKMIWLDNSITNTIHRHNPLFTFLMTGFFLNQILRPQFAFGYDVNSEFPPLWSQFTYAMSPSTEIRIGSVLYMGSKFKESHLVLNKYADRNVFYTRFRYWFL